MYVSGIRSGTLCRVFLRGPHGARVPAGTFRYRWGDDSEAVLSSALDLSRTRAIGVRAGNRTFVAPVEVTGAQADDNSNQEDTHVNRTTYAFALLALAAALAIAGCGSSGDSSTSGSSGGAYGGGGSSEKTTSGSEAGSTAKRRRWC